MQNNELHPLSSLSKHDLEVSEKLPSQRSARLDNIKGVLILLVVIGHIIQYWPGMTIEWQLCPITQRERVLAWMYSFIYAFHMPAFVFVSGYLTSRKQPLGEVAVERTFLYALAQGIGVVLIISLMAIDPTTSHLPWPHYATVPANWYLLSLVFWTLALPLLKNCRFPHLGLLVLCGLSLVAFKGMTWVHHFSLTRTVVFLPFFAAGYWCRENNWGLTGRKLVWLDSLTLAGLAIAVIRASQMHMQPLMNGNLPSRAASMLAAFAIIRLFFLLMPDKRCFLTRTGKNSLPVYIGHEMIILFLLAAFPLFYSTHKFAASGMVLVASIALAHPFLNSLLRDIPIRLRKMLYRDSSLN